MDDNVTPIRSAKAGDQLSAKFPKSVEEKIVVAKSIVLAVMAAKQSGELEGENYDQVWPLKMAAELLDQATDQLDRERLEVARG